MMWLAGCIFFLQASKQDVQEKKERKKKNRAFFFLVFLSSRLVAVLGSGPEGEVIAQELHDEGGITIG